MSSEERILELEAKVAELTAFVQQIQMASIAPTAEPPVDLASAPVPSDDLAPVESSLVEDGPRTASRRGMLKLAGAAAAGAAVAVTAHAMPAAADDGQPILAGLSENTTAGSRESTVLTYPNTLTPLVPNILIGTSPGNIFLARDEPGGFILFNGSVSSYPAASAGYSYRTVANGMYGYTGMTGAGVVGYGGGAGSTGVLARGAGANLELYAEGTAAPARADAHRLGHVVCDSNGDVWVCVVAGTPGTFRKISGAATAGAFHALSPGRVYDSRAAAPQQGTIGGSQNRTVSVADKRDPATGAVTTANFVPAGATAVAANVTVVSQSGAGFLTINPGGTTTVDSSTINYSAPGQILANGVTLTLNGNRELTVVAGGGGSTDFLIDIMGYYL